MTEGLLLIRRQRPIGDPTAIANMGSAPVAWYQGADRAGRLLPVLANAGFDVEPLTQLAIHGDVGLDQLAEVEIGSRFPTVVLGSHFVNTPDEARRTALLRLSLRHLEPRGSMIVEHHPTDWAETAADEAPLPGAALGMVDVRRAPPFVSAVSVFDVGGRVVRQPFTARVLSEADLQDVLGHVGLGLNRRVTDTLIEALPRA